MPGLVPGIHVLRAAWKGVDGRDRPGHDAAGTVGAHSSDAIALSCKRTKGAHLPRCSDRALFPSCFSYFIRLSAAMKSMKVRTFAERYLRLG